MRYLKSLLTLAILFAALFTVNAQTADKSVEEYLAGRAFLTQFKYTRAVEAFNRSIAIKPSSDAYLGLGIAYHNLTQYQEAAGAFKQVVQMAPANADGHYWLASTYENLAIAARKAGSSDPTALRNAEVEAREAVRLRPNYQAAYSVLAETLYRQGKYPDSVIAGERALTLKAGDLHTMYVLALAYAEVGRKPDAMKLYQKLLTLDPKLAEILLSSLNENAAATTSTRPKSSAPVTPGSAEYYVNEGNKFRDAENFPRAIAAYRRAIAMNPSLAEAHYNLGFSFYRVGQYPIALTSFQQAVKLEPTESSYHFWVGATNHQLKQYQAALASLQEAVRLSPGETTNRLWLGDVYAQGFEQYDKAIPEYQEAIRLDPDYAIPRNQLGLAYLKIDELESALSAFQGALKVEPEEPSYNYNLGYTYLCLGRREDAVAVQRKLQTLDQAQAKELGDSIEETFPAAKDNSGSLLILAGVVRDRPNTALPLYRRVLLLSTTPGEKAAAYVGMGDAFKAKGNGRKAIDAYQQAFPIYQRLVRLKPNEGYLLSGLGRTYVGLGQKDQAIQIYRRLQTISPDHAKDLLDAINKSQ